MIKTRKSVEVLPVHPFEVITGPMKCCTFRVAKNGRNFVCPKVTLTGNHGGRDPNIMKSASIKWGTLSIKQIRYWQTISIRKVFNSRWTAFVSSFLLSVDQHGLDYTMENNLSYIYSKNRLKKYQHFENSRQRRLQYRINPEDYKITEATLQKYPVEFSSPIIYLKLADVIDINIGLQCQWLERTDNMVEYEYYPDEGSDGSSGRYVRKIRPRIGEELFEPFANAS